MDNSWIGEDGRDAVDDSDSGLGYDRDDDDEGGDLEAETDEHPLSEGLTMLNGDDVDVDYDDDGGDQYVDDDVDNDGDDVDEDDDNEGKL